MQGDYIWEILNRPIFTGEEPTKFRSFATVEVGLSHEDHRNLADHMRIHGIDFQTKGRSCCVDWGDGVECYFSDKQRVDIDVVIDPRKSRIIEILGDRRIIPSDNYMTGNTLRFGRIGVKGVRADMALRDVMDQKQLADAIQASETGEMIETLQSERKKATDDVETLQSARKKAKHPPPKKPDKHVSGSSKWYTTAPDPKSDIMKGCEVCVLQAFGEEYEDALCIARSNGATLSYMFGPQTTTHVIAFTDTSSRFADLVKQGRDILRVQWLYDCDEQGVLLDLEPSYMWNTSAETARLFNERSDRFGDSYTKKMDPRKTHRVLTEKDDKWDYCYGDSDGEPTEGALNLPPLW